MYRPGSVSRLAQLVDRHFYFPDGFSSNLFCGKLSKQFLIEPCFQIENRLSGCLEPMTRGFQSDSVSRSPDSVSRLTQLVDRFFRNRLRYGNTVLGVIF